MEALLFISAVIVILSIRPLLGWFYYRAMMREGTLAQRLLASVLRPG